MKVIVKPNNIKNLDNYIKMGANAFFFGVKDFCVDITNEISIKDIINIKNKYPDIDMFLSINRNMFNNDIDKLKKILIKIDNLNIKGIFFYDLSILNIKKELNLKTPLIWNQNFLVTNYETCNYYKQKKVKGVLLSSEITLDEIKEIRKNTNMEIYINAYGYQLMSYSRRKLISNYFKFIKKLNIKKQHLIYENNDKYIIKEEKHGTAIYSKNILNLINEYKELKSIKIDYLILDEKFICEDNFIEVLDSYLNNKNIKTDTNNGFLFKKTIYKVKK